MESGCLTESANTEIRIKADERLVDILIGALLPEAERPTSPRSSVTINSEGDVLTLRIWASDIAALRAALNSYLRWADAIVDVVSRVR